MASYGCQLSPSGRATCKGCGEKIAKLELRWFSATAVGPDPSARFFYYKHIRCVTKAQVLNMLRAYGGALSRLEGFDALGPADRARVERLVAEAAGAGAPAPKRAKQEQEDGADAKAAAAGAAARAAAEPQEQRVPEAAAPAPLPNLTVAAMHAHVAARAALEAAAEQEAAPAAAHHPVRHAVRLRGRKSAPAAPAEEAEPRALGRGHRRAKPTARALAAAEAAAAKAARARAAKRGRDAAAA